MIEYSSECRTHLRRYELRSEAGSTGCAGMKTGTFQVACFTEVASIDNVHVPGSLAYGSVAWWTSAS